MTRRMSAEWAGHYRDAVAVARCAGRDDVASFDALISGLGVNTREVMWALAWLCNDEAAYWSRGGQEPTPGDWESQLTHWDLILDRIAQWETGVSPIAQRREAERAAQLAAHEAELARRRRDGRNGCHDCQPVDMGCYVGWALCDRHRCSAVTLTGARCESAAKSGPLCGVHLFHERRRAAANRKPP